MRLLPIIAAAVALTACQYVPGTAEHKIAGAQKAVAAQLKDPSSAQFTEVKTAPNGVCGQVNGKNVLGAYVGPQPFVWDAGTDQVLLGSAAQPSERDEHARAAYELDQCMVARAYASCQAGESLFTIKGKALLACSADLIGG